MRVEVAVRALPNTPGNMDVQRQWWRTFKHGSVVVLELVSIVVMLERDGYAGSSRLEIIRRPFYPGPVHKKVGRNQIQLHLEGLAKFRHAIVHGQSKVPDLRDG